MQIAHLLESTEQDGCDQSASHSPRSRHDQVVLKSLKAQSLEDNGKVSDILEFLDAVSQQVLWPSHDSLWGS